MHHLAHSDEAIAELRELFEHNVFVSGENEEGESRGDRGRWFWVAAMAWVGSTFHDVLNAACVPGFTSWYDVEFSSVSMFFED